MHCMLVSEIIKMMQDEGILLSPVGSPKADIFSKGSSKVLDCIIEAALKQTSKQRFFPGVF